ncbi:uncharacterized protein LOC116160515 [Photinus pyralis]|uniref:uncharacterized protein LOC116160515 n=1 Tax=Photinus pyralis TaxID=7054 RepID=UPI0012670C87|nr:uncharacterized protein LOC116160515 [Photinus pyralis]
MESLKRTRTAIKATLTKFETVVNTLTVKHETECALGEAEIIQLRRRLSNAEALLAQFQDIQIQIDASNKDAQPDESQIDEFEERYYVIISAAKQLLNKCAPSNSTNSSNTANISISEEAASKNRFIKLPSINIPNFTGEHQEWLNFRDMFTSLIHDNSNLSEVHKLHYLKASLSGKAAEIIKNLSLTSDNYELAWTGLNDRYNNNKILIHHHIKGLFSIETMGKESSIKLRTLVDIFKRNLRSFESLVDPIFQRDALLTYLLYSKLDSTTTREYENLNTNSTVPNLSDLIGFIERKASLLETLEHRNSKPPSISERPQSKSFVVKEQRCAFCSETHFIFHCEKFKNLAVSDRIAKAKQLKLCLNCLSRGHVNNKCKSAYKCATCKLRHNTLLHLSKAQPTPNVEVSDNIESSPPANTVAAEKATVASLLVHHTNVLLSTAVGDALDCTGNPREVRMLLDSGSQGNFITEKMSKRLNLDKQDIEINVTGLANRHSLVKAQCKVRLFSKHNKYSLETSCLIIPEITGSVPSQNIDVSQLCIPVGIKLADPYFNVPQSIDILLGAHVFYELMCIGQISLGPQKPILQKTRFGWVVGGPINFPQPPVTMRCNLVAIGVQEQLARFWELEELPSDKPRSLEEIECESNFVKTTQRDPEGRFIVKIPMKDTVSKLGDSYEYAKKCLYSLERRLKVNADLRIKYHTFLKEYADLKHMTPSCSTSKNSYYLPHHGVLKNEKVTTKLRVVFNASAKTTSGRSLNELQAVGPVIQRDLFSIVVSFRMYRYAISADIEKMYRQVLICPSQRHLQRILWRNNDAEEPLSYDLNTVTYGTAAASFLAVRSLYQLGIECESTAPDISNIIKRDFYVDDLMTGADTMEQAQKICRELPKILNSGCFPLRKWMSNDPKVLENIEADSIHPHLLEIGSHEHTKTLGLSWSFHSDRLIYFISKPNFEKATKRAILSETAQIYDPLGLVSPCTVAAKLILQQIWILKLDWDDNIPKNLYEKWYTLRSELILLNDLKVPRQVTCINPTKLEMHGFCDASTQAYAASVYIRSVDIDGHVSVHLLCAKSKVAPLKTITVPRLELCGALLLTRLTNTIVQATSEKVKEVYLWTDSTIVLGWLKTPPNQLKTFVSHRIAEIQTSSANWNWLHVPTDQNPSDLLSRGCSPSQLTL